VTDVHRPEEHPGGDGRERGGVDGACVHVSLSLQGSFYDHWTPEIL
jgi:hypothetical protein